MSTTDSSPASTPIPTPATSPHGVAGPVPANDALRREVDGISQKMLGQTLRKLQRNGLVHRRAIATMPMTVEYGLTAMGHTLLPVVEQLRTWSMRNIDHVTAAQARFDQAGSGTEPVS